MSKFIKADIGKLESFITESENAITEFAEIKEEFDDINKTLIKNWKGEGKKAYKQVADHITEKIGSIKEVLDTINDTLVKDLVEQYNKIDADLSEYNKTAGDPE
jgi:uncharacterized protein YukE